MSFWSDPLGSVKHIVSDPIGSLKNGWNSWGKQTLPLAAAGAGLYFGGPALMGGLSSLGLSGSGIMSSLGGIGSGLGFLGQLMGGRQQPIMIPSFGASTNIPSALPQQRDMSQNNLSSLGNLGSSSSGQIGDQNPWNMYRMLSQFKV